MSLFFIWFSISFGFMSVCFILHDIKIELRYKNSLLENKNEILKKERK